MPGPQQGAHVGRWIGALWDSGTAAGGGAWREHALPSGAMHLVIRLDDVPLRIRAGDAAGGGTALRGAMVAGVRDRWTLREGAAPTRSLGAMIDPAACRALFGVDADVLAGHHVPLEDLLGGRARALVDAVADAPDAATRRALLRRFLCDALRAATAPTLPLRDALLVSGSIGAAVRASGYSHRGYIARFRRETGLVPQDWRRLRRLNDALARLRDAHAGDLGQVAHDGGWSDQSHFGRDFRRFAGTTPDDYRCRAPPALRHLPMPAAPPGSIPF